MIHEHIKKHLLACSSTFEPELSSYVNIDEYAKKLANQAELFVFDSEDGELIGLVAAYDNAPEKIGWITNVSVDPEFTRNGIAAKLLEQCIGYFKKKYYNKIKLEVYSTNTSAQKLYKKFNFTTYDMKDDKLILELDLETDQRNYDEELKDTSDHKYAYNFDFEVMHPYYMKAALPYLNISPTDSCLELGSSKGHFTKQLLKYFNKITCIEASKEAISQAKVLLNDPDKKFDKHWRKKSIRYYNTLFENASLNSNVHSTIFLTHVLEHIEHPIHLLKQINNWLSETGTFILICPNANAPSRQIAVKMGLIPNVTAVTESEMKHGHYRTYTLDTMEADARKAGLEVVARTGIFFKGLANFQWDIALEHNIVSKEYLDGCFALGQQYPDLCSSIMLICKKGNQ